MKSVKKRDLIKMSTSYYHRNAGAVDRIVDGNKVKTNYGPADFCVIKFGVVVSKLCPIVTEEMLKKIIAGFPEARTERYAGQPIFLFKVKSSAECSGGDIYDEKTGKKIARAKALIKVYDITKRLSDIVTTQLLGTVAESEEIAEYMETLENREYEVLDPFYPEDENN